MTVYYAVGTTAAVPRGRASRTVAPTQPPVSVTEITAQSRIDILDDGFLIQRLTMAAAAHVESVLQRSLMTQTWQTVYDDDFPDEIKLVRPPVQSVSSVSYVDEAGAAQTLDAADYRLIEAAGWNPRIVPAHGVTWPATRTTQEAVTVTYITGHATAALVPEDIRHAVALLTAHWYEHREAAMEGREFIEMPWAVRDVLTPHLIPAFA